MDLRAYPGETVVCIGFCGLSTALDALKSGDMFRNPENETLSTGLSFIKANKEGLLEKLKKEGSFLEKGEQIEKILFKMKSSLCYRRLENEDFYHALWNFSEENSLGICIKGDLIPMSQSVILVLDEMKINPYLTDSTGVYVVATSSPMQLIDALKEEGIDASQIGYFTDNNDRIVVTDGQVSYLSFR